MLALPLMREDVPIGTIMHSSHGSPTPLPISKSPLLKTFADQAVIAIENVRLFKELQDCKRRAHRSLGAADGHE